MKPTVVSLFSGGGGLDLGFINAGYKIIWAIDNNANAVNTYKENIGAHIRCADITKENVEQIPKADVVIGGPPCQSFSLAGNRHVEDARGQLVWRYIDIIKHVKPKAFVFENVTGLLSAKNSEKESIVELLKKAFQNIGYTVEMKVMNAAEYGIPQKRKRVIIVGLQGDKKFVFPEPTHGDANSGLKPFVTVQDALGDLPRATNDENESVAYVKEPQNDYQKRMRLSGETVVSEHFMSTLSDLDRYIISHVKPGGNYMDIPKDVNSKRIQRLQRDGGHTTCYGRMLPLEPSYTINTYFNRPNVGCNIHYSEDRLITVREALRLQSFPDNYKIVSSSKQGRNLIVGNAVPPMLAEVIAKKLKKEIDKDMISYSDSETGKYHPLCEDALNQAIAALGLGRTYEVKHEQYTESLRMDFVIVNINTGRYLCVVEVKRTPADVQSTRYQFQAQSYVQLNQANNERPFYVITNLEKLISFRYDASKPGVHQQILQPGLESVCDFSVDNERAITNKLSTVFQRLIGDFINDRYTLFTTLDSFLTYMKTTIPNSQQWKSSMAVLMYEYIRGAFHSVHKSSPTITYNVTKFAGNVQQICNEGNKVDFDGIFSYNALDYLPRLVIANSMLSNIYNYGKANISGDAIADALHNMVSENNRHDGEVATDLELANLVSTVAKKFNGNIHTGKKICDPAAGSGNLISSTISIFGIAANQIIANDINPKLLELLSLRLGLNYPQTINRTNAPTVLNKDIVNLTPADFTNVEVILLNPPFMAGINCVNRKIPFFNKIRALKGSNGITEIGQQNLGAVFLETVCYLIPKGTTIACIFPKAQLMERGVEAVAFRRMLLGVFGLQGIFNYPGEGLFETVTEETCILIGKIGTGATSIRVYSSDVNVADIDLHAFEQYAGGYNSTQFDSITADLEAREISKIELASSVEDGWRMVCSEMSEAISFVETNIVRNPKMILLPNTAVSHKSSPIQRRGGTELAYFNAIKALHNKYVHSVTLDEGMRNAEWNEFILTTGDSKFLNFNNLPVGLATSIINDYIPLAREKEKQRTAGKTVAELKKIMEFYGKLKTPANCVLLPTKTRKDGRIHVTTFPIYVSSNFTIFSYGSINDAIIEASYLTTIFYQLECEVMSKGHTGLRKTDKKDAESTHAPALGCLTATDRNTIMAEAPNITFQNLKDPSISHIDEIWAEILFGANAANKLDEALRLLRFLANRRNPKK